MKVKLSRIPPLPAAKLAAAVYGCLSLVFVPFMLIGGIAGFASGIEGSVAGMGMLMIIMIPVLNIVTGFIATLVGCFVYNLAAGWMGGIELHFDPSDVEI